jgi:hypothetical protein
VPPRESVANVSIGKRCIHGVAVYAGGAAHCLVCAHVSRSTLLIEVFLKAASVRATFGTPPRTSAGESSFRLLRLNTRRILASHNGQVPPSASLVDELKGSAFPSLTWSDSASYPGVEFEEIAVRVASRRAWTSVTDFPKIIAALARTVRRLLLPRDILGESAGIRWQIEQHPMYPGSHRCVGIVSYLQCRTFSARDHSR